LRLSTSIVKAKSKVKGSGQECPLHTSNGNINGKNGAASGRGAHSSKTATDGAASFVVVHR